MRMKSRGWVAVQVLIAVTCLGTAAAWGVSQWIRDLTADGKNDRPGVPVQGGGLLGPRGTGVIQYDPPGAADSMLGLNGNVVGNVFNTRVNNPLETGNVTQMAFYIGGADATFPYFGIIELSPFSVQTLPASAGIVPFTFNTVALGTGAATVTPPFMGGVLISSFFTSSADSVGMQSQSTQGQGFHAGSLPYGGPVILLPGNNAMVRVAGSVWVVPVELMDFEAEAE
jgi:hypothetical protein